MKTRVLQVDSLAEFLVEVRSPSGQEKRPILRLSLTETRHGGDLPVKAVSLDLMGVNERDEVVWLHYDQRVTFLFGDAPASERDRSLYEGLREMHELVAAYLAERGYEVRGGRYALPADLRPLRGRFECTRWVKAGEESFAVVPAAAAGAHDE